jgi:hypothetical protein
MSTRQVMDLAASADCDYIPKDKWDRSNALHSVTYREVGETAFLVDD